MTGSCPVITLTLPHLGNQPSRAHRPYRRLSTIPTYSDDLRARASSASTTATPAATICAE